MKSQSKDKNSLFRIKDLIEKTGVSRETIHFYLAEGLLPEPQKTSKNMSWYSDEHIKRLNIIRELQEKQFLPLKAIKVILNNANDHNFTDEQKTLIADIKVKLINENMQNEQTKLSDVLKKYDISDLEIDEMNKINYIDLKIKSGKKFIRNQDLELIEAWIKLKEMGINQDRGFSPENLEIFCDIAEIIFNQEFKLFTEKLSGLNGIEATEIINKTIPVINNIISNLHQKKINEFIDNFNIQIKDQKNKDNK
ncbi:MAG: MerR family transcriptional regulator [Candidatus Sericytochromatia bacterium]|nr:MerR family transcriptional regulator [Candidatus Sericytochromatia bacterium]